jgi:DNA-binding MarR family transcriptional regulator
LVDARGRSLRAVRESARDRDVTPPCHPTNCLASKRSRKQVGRTSRDSIGEFDFVELDENAHSAQPFRPSFAQPSQTEESMQPEIKGPRVEGRNPTKGAAKLPPDARIFAHPRLEICAAIARRAGLSFRVLCDELELSDGNLSAHLRALENDVVIDVERGYDGRRRVSRYRLTDSGRDRLRAYVEKIRSFAHALEPHIAPTDGAGRNQDP